MSAKRDEITAYANDLLKIDHFRDYGPNGMQVIGKVEVNKVALGVSANLELFRMAADRNADMIIVHHGLLWDRSPREITALMKSRLKILFDHDITLLAYHLPLDAHPVIGNNVQWISKLGFEVEATEFGFYNGSYIGAIGVPSGCVFLRDLIAQISDLSGGKPLVYDQGPETVRKLAVITGGAQSSFTDAVASGCDTYLTGEVGEPTAGLAAELGANFIAAGHYNSEKFGIQALGAMLEKEFGVESFFCDVPNPI